MGGREGERDGKAATRNPARAGMAFENASDDAFLDRHLGNPACEKSGVKRLMTSSKLCRHGDLCRSAQERPELSHTVPVRSAPAENAPDPVSILFTGNKTGDARW